MQGLGPAGRGGFDEKKHLGRESKQGKAEKGWIWKETDQGITSYFCGYCLKSEKKQKNNLYWSVGLCGPVRPSVNIIELLNMSDRFPRWLWGARPATRASSPSSPSPSSWATSWSSSWTWSTSTVGCLPKKNIHIIPLSVNIMITTAATTTATTAAPNNNNNNNNNNGGSGSGSGSG